MMMVVVVMIQLTALVNVVVVQEKQVMESVVRH